MENRFRIFCRYNNAFYYEAHCYKRRLKFKRQFCAWRSYLALGLVSNVYLTFPWMISSIFGERILRLSSSTRLKRFPSFGVLR